MLSFVEVVTPAEDYKLISLESAKLALDLTDTSYDEKLTELIERVSDEISALCNNRVFAKEEVIETFYGDPTSRLFLSRFPVDATDIESVEVSGLAVTNYVLDNKNGILYLASGWSPAVVSYAGGYVLPAGAPKALQQAALMLLSSRFSEAQQAVTAGSGIKSVSHEGSTVTYMTPNEMSGSRATSSSGGSATLSSVQALLNHYMRIWV